jgi:hypothetical protein
LFEIKSYRKWKKNKKLRKKLSTAEKIMSKLGL